MGTLELVLIAVAQNGENLKYGSDRLRNNKKVVLTAIKNTYSFNHTPYYMPIGIDYMSKELKEDPEIKHEEEESIKDEVGDEFKPETETQQQEQQQVETMWQNRFQSWDRKSITLLNTDKKKEEAVQAMQDVEIGHVQEEILEQQQLEEQRG